MHNTRPFMPPFPGTEEEAGALAEYLISLPTHGAQLEGAQNRGVRIAPERAGLESAAGASHGV
jgi:hypothetical protein